MKDTNIVIKEYKAICNQIFDIFVDKYFHGDAETQWGDEVGGIIFIDDYHFSITDMLEYMKYKYSKKDVFKYHNYAMDCEIKNISPTNIKNYKK